jgi:hypothetical protein
MTVGRLLERLIGMSTQLGCFVASGALGQGAGMELMLELFDSAITFRARYQRHQDLLALTDLLVLDSANPRSLAGVLRGCAQLATPWQNSSPPAAAPPGPRAEPRRARGCRRDAESPPARCARSCVAAPPGDALGPSLPCAGMAAACLRRWLPRRSSRSRNALRLCSAGDAGQRLAYRPLHTASSCSRLQIEPAPLLTQDSDSYGNARFVQPDQPHAPARARAQPWPGSAGSFDRQRALAAGTCANSCATRPGHYDAAVEFAQPSPYVPRLQAPDYAVASFGPGQPVALGALELMRRIHADFEFKTTSTDVDTPLIEAFEQRSGVCQDFAHLMIAALRMLGLAARYVSGYLLTIPPPGQQALLGADASHAWRGVP